ncbi:hypothetical protein BXY82_1961 [Gelidibacter sediminis]|uniref:Uncharacterized protein n=1 Tax=Gelidibacter sediminis TaxID=1608710 RepID=A0A4R7PY60_9FLAO|nr:hypothetical protein [Gelidibacter sediminis]TDU39923.1 hypothetical protein BXY82_1961 [Gelidibacter sediminis]
MKTDKQYRIDLWIFIGSVIVLLYLIIMNIMFDNEYNSTVLRAIMELITIPIFTIGAFIPLIVIFRGITKRTESRSLAILTMLFSLLTGIIIGYSTLL